MAASKQEQERRFLDRIVVDERSGCWLWQGFITRSGHGLYRRQQAHRWAYEQFIGKIPAKRKCHHRCLTRSCVNPLHIELVTTNAHIERHRELWSLGLERDAV